MSYSPSRNDRMFDLWWKIAQNLYEYGVAQGLAGLTPPYGNDTEFDLKKKIAYYTASLAAI